MELPALMTTTAWPASRPATRSYVNGLLVHVLQATKDLESYAVQDGLAAPGAAEEPRRAESSISAPSALSRGLRDHCHSGGPHASEAGGLAAGSALQWSPAGVSEAVESQTAAAATRRALRGGQMHMPLLARIRPALRPLRRRPRVRDLTPLSPVDSNVLITLCM